MSFFTTPAMVLCRSFLEMPFAVARSARLFPLDRPFCKSASLSPISEATAARTSSRICFIFSCAEAPETEPAPLPMAFTMISLSCPPIGTHAQKLKQPDAPRRSARVRPVDATRADGLSPRAAPDRTQPVIGSHLQVLAGLALALHGIGLVTAVHAVMKTRTSQGAIAWAFALITVPYGALPFYWVFGRDRFMGYVKARRQEGAQVDNLRASLAKRSSDVALLPAGDPALYGVFDRLAQAPFVAGNQATLLEIGRATFDAIFAGIDAARSYVLVQFFIVHDDQIGRQLQARLIAKARQGVKVFFLYDEIGSHELPKRYLRELREASVEARPFLTSRDFRNRFQINFRNHRKIVVVDGKTAYVGGHNVGDEYLGRDPHFGHWRDTHVAVSGPAAMAVQLCFLDDWHWSTGEVLQLDWTIEPHGGQAVL